MFSDAASVGWFSIHSFVSEIFGQERAKKLAGSQRLIDATLSSGYPLLTRQPRETRSWEVRKLGWIYFRQIERRELLSCMPLEDQRQLRNVEEAAQLVHVVITSLDEPLYVVTYHFMNNVDYFHDLMKQTFLEFLDNDDPSILEEGLNNSSIQQRMKSYFTSGDVTEDRNLKLVSRISTVNLLKYCIQNGFSETLLWLLENASLEAVREKGLPEWMCLVEPFRYYDKFSNTALLEAAYDNQPTCLGHILKHHDRYNHSVAEVRDKRGSTAWDLAEERQYIGCMHLLAPYFGKTVFGTAQLAGDTRSTSFLFVDYNIDGSLGDKGDSCRAKVSATPERLLQLLAPHPDEAGEWILVEDYDDTARAGDVLTDIHYVDDDGTVVWSAKSFQRDVKTALANAHVMPCEATFVRRKKRTLPDTMTFTSLIRILEGLISAESSPDHLHVRNVHFLQEDSDAANLNVLFTLLAPLRVVRWSKCKVFGTALPLIFRALTSILGNPLVAPKWEILAVIPSIEANSVSDEVSREFADALATFIEEFQSNPIRSLGCVAASSMLIPTRYLPDDKKYLSSVFQTIFTVNALADRLRRHRRAAGDVVGYVRGKSAERVDNWYRGFSFRGLGMDRKQVTERPATVESINPDGTYNIEHAFGQARHVRLRSITVDQKQLCYFFFQKWALRIYYVLLERQALYEGVEVPAALNQHAHKYVATTLKNLHTLVPPYAECETKLALYQDEVRELFYEVDEVLLMFAKMHRVMPAALSVLDNGIPTHHRAYVPRTMAYLTATMGKEGSTATAVASVA